MFLLYYENYIKKLNEFIEQHPNQRTELEEFKYSIEKSVACYIKQPNLTLLTEQMNAHVNQIQQKLQQGIWRNLNPIIKGLLGALALLTVIPALVVEIRASRGFFGTFFMPEPEISDEFKKRHLDEVLRAQ
jgi:hypothetical protein